MSRLSQSLSLLSSETRFTPSHLSTDGCASSTRTSALVVFFGFQQKKKKMLHCRGTFSCLATARESTDFFQSAKQMLYIVNLPLVSVRTIKKCRYMQNSVAPIPIAQCPCFRQDTEVFKIFNIAPLLTNLLFHVADLYQRRPATLSTR